MTADLIVVSIAVTYLTLVWTILTISDRRNLRR